MSVTALVNGSLVPFGSPRSRHPNTPPRLARGVCGHVARLFLLVSALSDIVLDIHRVFAFTLPRDMRRDAVGSFCARGTRTRRPTRRRGQHDVAADGLSRRVYPFHFFIDVPPFGARAHVCGGGYGM